MADSDTTRDPSKLFFQADGIRRYIISAYWLVILLALPLWWSTTSIERLSLPSSQVTSQAQNNLRIPVRLSLDLDSDGSHVAKQLQNSINEHIQRSPDRWEGLQIHVDSPEEHPTGEVYTIVRGSGVARVQGRQLEYPVISSTISELTNILSSLIAPYPTTHEQDHRVAQYSPRYRLSFTLLNEDAAAGNSISEWDVAGAITRHISPILSQLSVLHNFTIESQVQFHAPLAFNPRPLDDAFGVSSEDLAVFINSAEWTLSSSASNDPVLHFVLFVPSASRRPLHILDNTGSISASNAFLLPQWGGIVIQNPPPQETPQTQMSTSSLDPIFSTFATHLLTLLGAPTLPPGVLKTSNTHILTNWQLDALLRYRALTNARGSKDTLQSIIKLVDQIENMPVGQDVRGDIQGALVALEQMYRTSATSLTETLRHSARALTLSSRAFFNPGMLALLYFPAEHKYAVYTPMFASAVIPLFVAALKELAAWRRQRRQNTPAGDQPIPARQ